jgi:sugar transferase (PEP-CTERM/EpsH1 system associated)
MTEGRAGRPVPLVAHVIHRLDVGGMENGLVNLINHMPIGTYRHAIVCMTDYTEFSRRIRRDDVTLHALGKREGKDLRVHLRLRRLLQTLRPDIVHTRNLATLEAQVTAAISGVKARVHGEHGWDVGDLDGSRGKNRLMRRLVRPLVGQYIALSRHQMDYLARSVGVRPERLSHVCNGVDIERFSPRPPEWQSPLPEGFAAIDSIVIGTVLRMQTVKAPEDLARAFILLRERMPDLFPRLRLVMVGDGPLKEPVSRMLSEAGVTAQVWLPGAREDVPELMRAMDVFVLPSLAEGICNTILEAMASGLPVIATDVGGNPDLVAVGETGTLVPAGDPQAMAESLVEYVSDAERREREGSAARAGAEKEFSMEAMVRGYMEVYARVLGTRKALGSPPHQGE